MFPALASANADICPIVISSATAAHCASAAHIASNAATIRAIVSALTYLDDPSRPGHPRDALSRSSATT